MRRQSSVTASFMRLMTGAAFLAALSASAVAAEQAVHPTTEGTESCLSCHGESQDRITFDDGSKRPVRVDAKSWGNSVHGGKLSCTDCHREISGYPHRKAKFADSRDYTLARANTCQRCHYAHYTRVLDSTHYEVLKAGMREAPTCVDCHGSHAIHDPRTPRKGIAENCASCHKEVSEAYAASVHGKALTEKNNPDVPVCTDCHGAHAIGGPAKAADFRLDAYKSCAQCHGDKERMAKYGLNTAVLTTYLDDFHGSSNRLYAMGAGTPKRPIATCTDCHGVHSIESLRGENHKSAPKERVVQTCQKCHGDATPAFAAAWLSHYEPSPTRAPLVWAIKLGYKILIPLMVVGLILHIMLHLWRLRSHR